MENQKSNQVCARKANKKKKMDARAGLLCEMWNRVFEELVIYK